jgi:hypothetical protein
MLGFPVFLGSTGHHFSVGAGFHGSGGDGLYGDAVIDQPDNLPDGIIPIAAMLFAFSLAVVSGRGERRSPSAAW